MKRKTKIQCPCRVRVFVVTVLILSCLINRFGQADAAILPIVKRIFTGPATILLDTTSISLSSRPSHLVTPDVPYGIRGISGSGVVVRLLDENDPGTLLWSNETAVRHSSKGHIIMYNYTIDDKVGVGARWMKREYVPVRRLDLKKRGWPVSSDKTWNFKRASPSCAAVIYLCFDDNDSLSQLGDIVQSAIEGWHSAMGDESGFQFKVINTVFCGPTVFNAGILEPNMQYNVDVVHLKYISGIGAASTDGYIKVPEGTPAGDIFPARHYLILDPAAFGHPQTATPVGAFMHELGHIFGLNHEHQRPDAASYVKFNCGNLNGHDEFHLWLLQKKEDKTPIMFNGALLTVDEVCTDPALAKQYYRAAPTPFNVYAYLLDVPQDDDRKPIGAFDWDSIMLYSSATGAYYNPNTNTFLNVLTRVSDGSTWGANNIPSKIDVETLRTMYPDIVL